MIFVVIPNGKIAIVKKKKKINDLRLNHMGWLRYFSPSVVPAGRFYVYGVSKLTELDELRPVTCWLCSEKIPSLPEIGGGPAQRQTNGRFGGEKNRRAGLVRRRIESGENVRRETRECGRDKGWRRRMNFGLPLLVRPVVPEQCVGRSGSWRSGYR